MKKITLRNLIAVLSVGAGIALFAAASTPSYAQADPRTLVYDSISGLNDGVNGVFTAATAAPRTFTGDIVNFYYPPSGPVTITAIDLGFAYRGTAATTLSALNVGMRFYEVPSTTSTDLLQSPVTNVMSFDIRSNIVSAYNAQNGTNFTADTFVFTPNTNYFYQLQFPATFTFADQNINGIALNYSANAGSGIFSNDTLTSVLRVGSPIHEGSSGITSDGRGGYLRNVSGRTDYNFNQGDARTTSVNGFSDNAALAMRLYTNVIIVPETNTLALIAIGAVAPLTGLILRRRKKSA